MLRNVFRFPIITSSCQGGDDRRVIKSNLPVLVLQVRQVSKEEEEEGRNDEQRQRQVHALCVRSEARKHCMLCRLYPVALVLLGSILSHFVSSHLLFHLLHSLLCPVTLCRLTGCRPSLTSASCFYLLPLLSHRRHHCLTRLRLPIHLQPFLDNQVSCLLSRRS